MSSDVTPLRPVSLSREGEERLRIRWNDGHDSVYTWAHLRNQCPCAGCREERAKPPDPFRILKPSELQPLRPVALSPVGHYAYKITWNDGHDSGIFTLEHLRQLCQCPQCQKTAPT
jgi:DUF971 family protein